MSALPNQVRLLTYLDSGAPNLVYAAGGMITLLDAVLVNGYGSVTLTSLVVASNIATATVSGGHNLSMYGSGDAAVGPVIRIEGATPAGLNGDWRLSSVPDGTTFTFEVSGIPDQTATGTITAKRAPLGFTKPYSGTNLAAYRQGGGNQFYLRVDDTATYDAKVRGYEAMTGISTGAGEFPTTAMRSNGYYITKRATTGNSPWFIIGTDRLFYIGIAAHSSYGFYEISVFGDVPPLSAGDGYATFLGASTNTYSSYGYSNHPWYRYSATQYLCVARPLSGVGTAQEINTTSFSLSCAGSFSGSTGSADYPNPTDNSLILSGPTYAYVYGTTGYLRAEFPGAVWVNNYVERYEMGDDSTFVFYKTPSGVGYAADKYLMGFHILTSNSATPGFGFVDLLTDWHI